MRNLAVAEEHCVGRWRGSQPLVPGLPRLRWVLFCLASVPAGFSPGRAQRKPGPPSAGDQES